MQVELARIAAAGWGAEGGVEATADLRQLGHVAGLRQLGENRPGVDLQRPAHGLRERAGEGDVGQLGIAIGLERFELARRDLDRSRQRRDVQAPLLTGRSIAPALASAPGASIGAALSPVSFIEAPRS
jgi:hypothetical protein